jgi:glycosyltransferase involved in cell wall biosynthesis
LQHNAKSIPNLILVEYVDPLKMSAFYMKSKLYVLTSDFEGFSNTMAEAMQSQCAVLSYNVNPDNILNDYNCGICADGDVNRFFEAFEYLNSNRDAAHNLGQNAADYIRNHHGMEENTILFKNCLL